ncbi:MAG: DUF2357 domain-containing protein, partial [Phycisphaerales bacterium]
REQDEMLRDLTRVLSGLPFSGPGGLRLEAARRRGDPAPLYHAFSFLRSELLGERGPSPVEVALQSVLRDPHVRWMATRRTVPLARLQHADHGTVSALLRANLVRVGDQSLAAGPATLAAKLGGHLPTDVVEPARSASVDLTENRFVLALLDQMLGIVRSIEDVVPHDTREAFQKRVLEECSRIRAILEPIRRHSMWREVGVLTRIPAESTVLQRRRGYKDLYRLYQRLRLVTSIPLDDEDARSLLEGKDIALLYELWCYFQMTELVSGLIGRPIRVRFRGKHPVEIKLPHDFRVEWKSGVTLTYNARFSRSRPRSRQSYSTPLRPDIVLEVPHADGTRLHVFDAKFRLQQLTSIGLGADDESEDIEAQERHGTFKRADLYKMHTYRDALPSVRSVWVLYPGSEMKFFDAPGATEPYSGVGAVPLRPGGRTEDMAGVLRALLWSSSRATPAIPTDASAIHPLQGGAA